MLLCDTGPLVAAAIRTDPDHAACVALFQSVHARREVIAVPAPVLAETGYLLGSLGGAGVEAKFLRRLTRPGFATVDLIPQDLERMAELVEQYGDFPLGTTDAAVMALAERFGVRQVATLDRRHFTAVRLRHAPYLDLVPSV
ncbi:MAG: PIN domain-containing protein [Propionibacteriaceae bacterium]|jgi:predicted nucleic acid-binding protein|nr:PIN domain-containing protein [Propionibacteriaceae bacterium]